MHRSRQQPLLVLGPARCPRSPVQLAAAGLSALVSWAGRAGLGCLLTWFSPHLRFLEEEPWGRPPAAPSPLACGFGFVVTCVGDLMSAARGWVGHCRQLGVPSCAHLEASLVGVEGPCLVWGGTCCWTDPGCPGVGGRSLSPVSTCRGRGAFGDQPESPRGPWRQACAGEAACAHSEEKKHR